VVIRLGVQDARAEEQGFVPTRYRILQGQQLHVQYVASTAATVRAWARVYYDNGVDSILYVADGVLTADRTPRFLSPSEVAIANGWVVDAVVECVNADVKRGQVYVKLLMALESRIFGTVLCSDYVSSSVGQVALGTYVQPGPGGGGGDLNWVAIKANGAPDSTFTYTLAISNMVRLLREIVWYYAASSTVASRVINIALEDTGGALPTGHGDGADSDSWLTPDLTLTADQDGGIFADQKRSGHNDNAALVIDDITTAPSPFPLLIVEEDLAKLRFTLTAEEVTDFDAVWGFFEEWVMP